MKIGSGEMKSKADKIWEICWTDGITTPEEDVLISSSEYQEACIAELLNTFKVKTLINRCSR